ncbi:MAG: hypothetical protein LBI91_04610 [Spirochaetaceae bacterium]|jgi:hypothetical protein|nr:hypothetical protein [Spirochaetaceae bacterium]
MKHRTGLYAALLALVSLLTACSPDSPGDAGVFVLERKAYYPPQGNQIPPEFTGNIPEIRAKINNSYDLGIVGVIYEGKLRLVLPAFIGDEHLAEADTGGTLKYGQLTFSAGVYRAVLSKNKNFDAELVYYNQDLPSIGIKKGWNFRYPTDDKTVYKYSNNIEEITKEGYVYCLVYTSQQPGPRS